MEKISEEEVELYKEAFAFFDQNGDGSISKSELGSAMLSLGEHLTDEELQGMIDEADLDGNGTVDFAEFLSLIASQKKAQRQAEEDELLRAFRSCDTDGDGYLSAMEVRLMMKKIGEKITLEEAEDMIKEADENNDGMVDFREFVNVMTRQYLP